MQNPDLPDRIQRFFNRFHRDQFNGFAGKIRACLQIIFRRNAALKTQLFGFI